MNKVITIKKIRELEEKFQEGFSGITECIEDHLADNANPSDELALTINEELSRYVIRNDRPVQKSLFLTIGIGKCLIPEGEFGEIKYFCRSHKKEAKMTIKWDNEMKCNYQLCYKERLPFKIRYNPE